MVCGVLFLLASCTIGTEVGPSDCPGPQVGDIEITSPATIPGFPDWYFSGVPLETVTTITPGQSPYIFVWCQAAYSLSDWIVQGCQSIHHDDGTCEPFTVPFTFTDTECLEGSPMHLGLRVLVADSRADPLPEPEVGHVLPQEWEDAVIYGTHVHHGFRTINVAP